MFWVLYNLLQWHKTEGLSETAYKPEATTYGFCLAHRALAFRLSISSLEVWISIKMVRPGSLPHMGHHMVTQGRSQQHLLLGKGHVAFQWVTGPRLCNYLLSNPHHRFVTCLAPRGMGLRDSCFQRITE